MLNPSPQSLHFCAPWSLGLQVWWTITSESLSCDLFRKIVHRIRISSRLLGKKHEGDAIPYMVCGRTKGLFWEGSNHHAWDHSCFSQKFQQSSVCGLIEYSPSVPIHKQSTWNEGMERSQPIQPWWNWPKRAADQCHILPDVINTHMRLFLPWYESPDVNTLTVSITSSMHYAIVFKAGMHKKSACSVLATEAKLKNVPR